MTFIAGVSILLGQVLTLNKDYTLVPHQENIIESFTPEGGNGTSPGFTAKLIATPSPNIKAKMTKELRDKLEVLKTGGPGLSMMHAGVKYHFDVHENAPPPPPPNSPEDLSDERPKVAHFQGAFW